MSSSAESRIVTMKFENSQFQQGATQTLSIMDRLKAALSFTGARKGVDDLQASANRFNMNGITGIVTGVSKSFLAMSTVAITALANITTRAISAGASLVKSLTIAPIMDGFHEYETNMNSIQTILSNTKDQGSNLQDVNKALGELNTYSDKTIYNFSEMARNIGTFTAAGVDLKTSVASIKGIANLAAISGSNSQQASTAMYQLSQAISAGRVGLQDWNSVVNAGMGGAVFQKALVRTAQNMGTIGKNAVKVSGPMKKLTINGKSFRQAITAKPGEESWLTSDVLTNTLKQFGGNMTKAQLKAQGFSDAQVKAIQEMGQMGVDAATQVKTLTQLMGTLKESVGSGWTKSWQIVFGNFGEAKAGFTAASNYFGGLITASAKARNKVLSDWKKFGGRDAAIDVLVNSFQAVLHILKPIKDAFREIFPATTGKQLAQITKNLAVFTDHLLLSGNASKNLKRTFAGVFAVFDIAKQIIGGVLGVFKDLLGVIFQGSGSFLEFTGGIGDFLVALDKSIKKGDALTGFFDGLSAVLQVPIKIIKAFAGYIADVFNGFDGGKADGAAKAFGRIGDRLDPLAKLAGRLKEAFGGLSGIFGKIVDALGPLGPVVSKALSSVGKAFANAFSQGSFNQTLDAINTGLLGGIVLLFKKFVSKGLNFSVFGGGGGMFASVTDAFEGLTGTLKAMQSQIQAKTLLTIAGAIAILTVSVVALSLIDSAKLTKALSAMSVGFGELLGAMAILVKISGAAGYAKIPLISASLILLSTSVLILTAALKNIAGLDWGQLSKGLLGIGALLLMVSIAVKPLSANSGGMIKAGAGILILSVALKVLASAVGDFAGMSWADIGKGMGSVAAALLLIAGAMKVMPKNMAMQATALLILGGALKVIASAVAQFAAMDVQSLAKGILAVAASLVIIAGAMTLMPPDMVLQAAALLLVSVALQAIGKSIAAMGGMSVEEIAKGLITLGAALLILAGGLALMEGALPGAAALLVAAAALAVLTPVLVALGAMSWVAIVKGMTTLAATFTLLGVAGFLLAPLSPVILALGAALLLLGAGMALAGVGALAFASAFAIVVAAGTAGVGVMTAMIGAIIKSIPQALAAFGRGIVAFAKAIGKGGPAFVHAFSAILSSMLRAVIKNIPLIGKAFSTLLATALRVVVRGIPAIVNAGLTLIVRFLAAISRHVPQITRIAADIAVKFINGIGKNAGRVAQAGANMVIKLINAVTAAINRNSGRLGTAGGELGVAIVRGMASGILHGAGAVASAAMSAAHSALSAAKHLLGIHSPSRVFRDEVGKRISEGLALGIDDGSRGVSQSASQVATTALSVMKVALNNASAELSTPIDVNPTITPILDLTKLANDASKIGGMLPDNSVVADVSLSRAASIAADRASAANSSTAADVPPVVKEVKFEQNNYSPKAISPVETYRNTRNLLSIAKGELANP